MLAITEWCGSARTNACRLSSSVHTERVQNVLRCSSRVERVADEPGGGPQLAADRERGSQEAGYVTVVTQRQARGHDDVVFVGNRLLCGGPGKRWHVAAFRRNLLTES